MDETLLRAKLVVLGDAACGKTSLVQVFHSDSQQGFPKAYSMTTGAHQRTNLFIYMEIIPVTTLIPIDLYSYIYNNSCKTKYFIYLHNQTHK